MSHRYPRLKLVVDVNAQRVLQCVSWSGVLVLVVRVSVGRAVGFGVGGDSSHGL